MGLVCASIMKIEGIDQPCAGGGMQKRRSRSDKPSLPLAETAKNAHFPGACTKGQLALSQFRVLRPSRNTALDYNRSSVFPAPFAGDWSGTNG